MPTVLWLRRDLRLRDHPALLGAADTAPDGRVLPLFVLDPTLVGSAGGPRRAALAQALSALQESYDGAVVVRSGDPATVVREVATELGAGSVHVSQETTPYGRRRDTRVERALAEDGRPLVATGSPYAVTPGRVRKADGTPYQVFTPFSRAWRDHGWRRPAEVPRTLRWASAPADDDALRALHSPPDGPQLLGGESSDASASAGVPGPLRPVLPAVGEQAALDAWTEFLDDGLEGYGEERNRPDLDSTSRLSVQLKYGTVHPRTLLADVAAHPAGGSPGARTFVSELCWREFYADVLWHHPASAWADLKPALAGLRYDDPGDAVVGERLRAWQEGRTGFPLVDAGMRQLLAEGWMHNRVRMVTASFLVKDLHLWWVLGARWFLEHLRDGDVASNSHGWQWVAGTGTDASPYVRVFNPVTQGERFDPDGAYVRRWVPELAHLTGGVAHRPWDAPDGHAHGYPERIVDHAVEREEALRRYAAATA